MHSPHTSPEKPEATRSSFRLPREMRRAIFLFLTANEAACARRVCRRWKMIIDEANLIPKFLTASRCKRLRPVGTDDYIVVGDFRESESKGDELVCLDPHNMLLLRLHLGLRTCIKIAPLPRELYPLAEPVSSEHPSDDQKDEGARETHGSGINRDPDDEAEIRSEVYRPRLSRLEFLQHSPSTIQCFILAPNVSSASAHSPTESRTSSVIIDVNTGHVLVDTPRTDSRQDGPWFPAAHLTVVRHETDLNRLIVSDSNKRRTLIVHKPDQHHRKEELLQFFSYRHFLGIYASGTSRQKGFFSFDLNKVDNDGVATCMYHNESWPVQFGVDFFLGSQYVTLDNDYFYCFETNTIVSLPYESNQALRTWKHFVLRYEGPDASEEDLKDHECWLRVYDLTQKKRNETEMGEEKVQARCVRQYQLRMKDWECGSIVYDGKYLTFRENGLRARHQLSFTFV